MTAPVLIAIIASVLLLLLLAIYAIATLLYRFALAAPKNKRITPEKDFSFPYEKIHMTSEDGISLTAYLSEAKGSHQYALLCHGYKCIPHTIAHMADCFFERGFSLLLPAARGHGESEGNYIGMGIHERKDIRDYCRMLVKRDPEAQILLFGISMGAATVMMASAEELPENVKCVIEDCGYTSVWEELSLQMKCQYHLPTFPFLYVAERVCRHRAGYTFREYSPLEAVRRTRLPILFIHGETDTFVPFAMVHPLYENAAGEKELLTVPDAEHALAEETNPALYWQAVDAFIGKHFVN